MRFKDAGNWVISRGIGNAQACREKYTGQENENSCNSADHGSPIRLAHRFAHSRQASSPSSSVDRRLTAVAVDDEDCLASEPCNAISSQLRGKAKPQAALIERLTGD